MKNINRREFIIRKIVMLDANVNDLGWNLINVIKKDGYAFYINCHEFYRNNNFYLERFIANEIIKEKKEN